MHLRVAIRRNGVDHLGGRVPDKCRVQRLPQKIVGHVVIAPVEQAVKYAGDNDESYCLKVQNRFTVSDVVLGENDQYTINDRPQL